jgi:hypothetical protein
MIWNYIIVFCIALLVLRAIVWSVQKDFTREERDPDCKWKYMVYITFIDGRKYQEFGNSQDKLYRFILQDHVKRIVIYFQSRAGLKRVVTLSKKQHT